MAELFKPIQVQKVPFGVDPKTVLCSFFKAGTCQKGTKCKFSHDTNVERKGAKRDVYTDKREDDAKEDGNYFIYSFIYLFKMVSRGNVPNITRHNTFHSKLQTKWKTGINKNSNPSSIPNI